MNMVEDFFVTQNGENLWDFTGGEAYNDQRQLNEPNSIH